MRETIAKVLMTALFKQVGNDYRASGLVSRSEVYSDDGVHAFYRLSKDPSKSIHVQGYPELSSHKSARVMAGLMDFERMMQVRRAGMVHASSFPEFGNGV